MSSTYPTVIPSRSILASYTSFDSVAIANVLVTETGFTATYKYDPASSASADGTTVIIPSNSPASGRWLIGVASEFSATKNKLLHKTANYPVTAADVLGGFLIIECDASGGAFTITIAPSLGSSSVTPLVTVVKADSSANVVNISDGSSVVGALVSAPIGVNMQAISVYSNGTNLRLI